MNKYIEERGPETIDFEGGGLDEHGDAQAPRGDPQTESRDGSEDIQEGYRRLVEASEKHAIFMLTTDGNILSWPPVARELYRYEPAEVEGKPLGILYADPVGDDSDSAAIQQRIELDSLIHEAGEQAVQVESWHKRADGSVFWATLTISPIANGHLRGFTVVVQNTTAKKQYQRMLERQNDRLKEFTDILSHDLRNPLSVIDGRLTLYEETGDKAHIEKIKETTERMERLIDDLLRVARQGNVVKDPQPTDLEDVVELAREGTLPKTALLRYEPVPRVMSDEDRLLEMFENLFRNAVEHGGTNVTVTVGPIDDDGFFVEDDGPGIDEEILDSVFDHGFTTVDDGTGFGLSVIRTIVGSHGWDIGIEASLDGGARFEVTSVDFVE